MPKNPKDIKKVAAVNPHRHLHWLDHLAVICIILDIPLFLYDEWECHLGEKFYPGLKTVLLDNSYRWNSKKFWRNFIQNYDVLVMSYNVNRHLFKKKYDHLLKETHKTFRSVVVPHGFSDKAYFFKKFGKDDIVLIYGQNMIDLLKEVHAFKNLNQYVLCGNYRYTYYKQHKSHYDKLVEKTVLNYFKAKHPIILYAPTWNDIKNASTFYDACTEIINNLPSGYNLIIKLHPSQKIINSQLFEMILTKYKDRPYLLFLDNYPLVFPILEYTDIYIGDSSSIGYDFLPFNKPMYFLKKDNLDHPRWSYLNRCGIEIKPYQYKDIYKIIQETLPYDTERFTEIRSQVFAYTFGIERPFEDIKADIMKAYESDN